jgi:hypothetical protein
MHIRVNKKILKLLNRTNAYLDNLGGIPGIVSPQAVAASTQA